MKVYITGRSFDVIVKDEGKKDIVMNANTEVFEYLNKYQKMLLGALADVNSKVKDIDDIEKYFNNAVGYLSIYAKSYNVNYLYNEVELSVPNELKNSSFVNIPNETEVKHYAETLEKVVSVSPVAVYEVDNISEVPLVCILHYSRYGLTIKRCKNCNNWFIPKTTKETKFCYRNDAEYETMQCKDAYKYKERSKKIENDEVYKSYKKIYNTLRNSCDRKKNPELAEQEFEKFKIENKKKVELLRLNKITENDYITWLNSKRKRTNKKD